MFMQSRDLHSITKSSVTESNDAVAMQHAKDYSFCGAAKLYYGESLQGSCQGTKQEQTLCKTI